MPDIIQTIKNKNGGVKTQAGKDISKYNSIRHGVFIKVLLKEEADEAEIIQSNFTEEYKPSTLTERLLIETMTITYIRFLRAIRAEQDYLMELIEPPDYELIVVCKPITPDLTDLYTNGIYDHKLISGHEALMKSDKVEELDRIYSRYIVTCERQFYRVLHELQRVQSIRNGIRPTSMAIDITSDKSE